MGVASLLRTILISDEDMKKLFASDGVFGQIFFTFQMSGRWFLWHTKGGCTPHINPEVFFPDTLVTESMLKTLYELVLGMYNHQDTLESLEKV